MLTFTDYQAGAARTVIYPASHQITYPALGLVGEATEALQSALADDRDDVAAEIGDVMWYLSALCGDCGTTLAEVAGTDSIAGYTADVRSARPAVDGGVAAELTSATIAAGRVAEHAKKMLRDRTDRRPQIVELAAGVLTHLTVAASLAGTTIEEVCAGNLAKLADRAARDALGGDGDTR